MPDMLWFRQIVSFGMVGILATISHVTLAWLLIEGTTLDKYVANLFGGIVAFSVSFFGNARFTFKTDASSLRCAGRSLFVTALSLFLSSAILAFVSWNGLPIYIYVLIVLATVPPSTFLLAKFWAFQPLVELLDVEERER